MPHTPARQIDSINALRTPAVENRLLRPAACAGARLVFMAERGESGRAPDRHHRGLITEKDDP
jgi:hypothetical protein